MQPHSYNIDKHIARSYTIDRKISTNYLFYLLF